MAIPTSIRASYPTLAALNAAYPSGTTGNFLVLDTNKWYTWSGSAWMPGGTFKVELAPFSNDNGVNVKNYNASGSSFMTTGSMAAGSNILNVADTGDFKIGQDVAIFNAGPTNATTFFEVVTPPTAVGPLEIIVEGVTYSFTLQPRQQIFEITFEGTSPAQKEFGIELDYNLKYVTVQQGETAVQFANRLRTDGFFTNYWPGWTISGTADTPTVRFTSVAAGPRQWGTQAFAYDGFFGEFTQIQLGTGDRAYVQRVITDVMRFAGYRHDKQNDYTAYVVKDTRGLAPAITYNPNNTGVVLNITQPVNGQGELITAIVDVDPINKTITTTTAATYAVTNVQVRHDDTRALQNVLNTFGLPNSENGYKVILPDGTYRHTGLWFKDKVSMIGASMASTILVNHDPIWSSIHVHGQGGSVASEPGFMDHWEISNMTLTTNKGANPVYTQIGLNLLFCHSVTMRDLNIRNHGVGVYEKCIWYTDLQNIYVANCIDGWVYPEFHPSSSPSARTNIFLCDNSGYGFQCNSPDVFSWVGGAVERNKKGGIKITGGTTRSLMFEGINIEENGGYQIEVGEEAGVAPTGVSFRNCSFKNWQSTKPRCAILLNRVIGFELQNPKFFNFDIGLIAEVTGSSFLISLPSFDGCRKAFKFTDLEVGTGHNLIVGDWGGVVGVTSRGFQQIGSQFLRTEPVTIGELRNLLDTGTGTPTDPEPVPIALTPQQRGFIHAAEDFGTIGTYGDGDDLKLQAAINKACELRLPLYVPPGDYKITFGLVADTAKYTAGVGATDRSFMMYGAGGTATRFRPTSYNFNVLTVQNGNGGSSVTGSGIAPSGYLKGIYIEGLTNHATTNNAIGLLLRGMRQFNVEDVTIKKMPIGFDMIDNCYGTVYNNCRTALGAVGMNLRAGAVSGSDMNFYNCWFAGNVAAVHISPDGGGWHFFGGQLGAGPARSADDDLLGAVILGKDYLTGATGTCSNIIFDGIDFEGTRHMHNFRSFGQITMTVRNSSFLQTDSSTAGLAAAPLAIWKATGAQQSKVEFTNNGVKGYWKSAKAIDVAGHGSLIEIHEKATLYESNVKFNNVAWTAGPMLVQSKCDLGHARWRQNWNSRYLVGPVMYEETVAALKRSTDWGVTWINTTDGGTF